MGYIEKKVLMEVLTSEGGFTDAELSFIDNTLNEDELHESAILKLVDINEFEKKGILKRFYQICEKHCFFPQWLEKIEKGIDHV